MNLDFSEALPLSIMQCESKPEGAAFYNPMRQQATCHITASSCTLYVVTVIMCYPSLSKLLVPATEALNCSVNAVGLKP